MFWYFWQCVSVLILSKVCKYMLVSNKDHYLFVLLYILHFTYITWFQGGHNRILAPRSRDMKALGRYVTWCRSIPMYNLPVSGGWHNCFRRDLAIWCIMIYNYYLAYHVDKFFMFWNFVVAVAWLKYCDTA